MADDVYSTIFSEDPRTGAPTFEQLQARRKIALALATRNRGFPKTIGEGLTYLGEALGDNLADQRSSAAEAAYKRQTDETVRRLSGADAGSSVPSAATATAPQAAPDTGGPMSVYDPVGGGNVSSAEATPSPAAAQMPVEEFKQRTARAWTPTEKDPYRAIIGPPNNSGDYGYGKYRVMGARIPEFTKQYLGKEMTPKEFLADDKAQEDLASARGGELLSKYGPNGAAAAWSFGEQGMNGDPARPNLNAHIAEYVKRFNIPLGDRNQIAASVGGQRPIQVASLGGMPTPDTGRDAMAQSLAGPPPVPAPAQQAPSPAQMQVAQAQQTPIGRPPPTPPPEVVPRYTAPAQQGPPPMPRQEPMTAREMEIRRAIGATTDPNFKGRLEPLAERLEAERKFKDTQNMAAWQKDYSAWEKRTDPNQIQQLQKGQEESAARARALMKEQERGGVSQAFIDKGIEESAKGAMNLRGASVSLNRVEDLLEKGIFSGTLGKFDLAKAKLKHSLGGPLDPRIAQTEEFQSVIAPITAAARQALVGGAQISNADLIAAEKASGGNINLDAESIKGIMKNLRVIQTQTALYHHGLLANSARGDPRAEATLYSLYGLPMENIVPKNDQSVERLMQKADNEHERELFNQSWKTPGLAEKIIARERARR